MKHSSSVGNLNTIDLTEPITTVTGTTNARGTVVDAVIKLYTLDHSYKFISVSQVSINQNIVYFEQQQYTAPILKTSTFSCLENYGR